MAAPKQKSKTFVTALDPHEAQTTYESPSGDERLAELLKRPGVTVRRGDPELARKELPPIGTVGTMTMAELRWLLGRIDDDELEDELRKERQSNANRAT